MRRFFQLILTLFTVGCVFVGGLSYAQTGEAKPTDYRQSFLANPYYDNMARQAIEQKPPRFDFMQFRAYYSQTRQYDPIGAQTLGQLNDLAYIVKNDSDPERVKTALFGYKRLVQDHLAHIDVVLHALSLSRTDKRFGDRKFYEWVRDGIMRTVVISGDGYTLAGAYDVITLSEETMLFNRMGFNAKHSEAVKEGIIYYTMHDVIDARTGAERAVFVNTSIPMKYMEALQEEQRGAFIRGRQ
ncbi:MAG: hypothetical protein H6861_03390 [Rhodospirillales bacterium]|nr:hypothetical protein [Rhodospirillales bacterium]